jgi:hypothetical protein
MGRQRSKLTDCVLRHRFAPALAVLQRGRRPCSSEANRHGARLGLLRLRLTPDFAGRLPHRHFPHPTERLWLHVDSDKAALLARANGQDESGTTYLPHGDRDAHKNYYPTVSPVGAGGYFWLFFTSKRNYGNLFVRSTGEDYPEAEKIWVSAIDIDTPPASDPSHPAFFLPGQELESGNIRAFASLEVCRADSASCDSGLHCY